MTGAGGAADAGFDMQAGARADFLTGLLSAVFAGRTGGPATVLPAAEHQRPMESHPVGWRAMEASEVADTSADKEEETD